MPLGTSLVAIEIGVLTGHETSVRDFTAQTRHTGIQVVAAEAAVGEVAVFRKWKWLLVNGCKLKTLISTTTEFLNLCQVMTNASLHFTIVLKNNYTLME